MDNPVFIAMEMPRFEIIIKNTSSSVESLADGPRSSSAEAARYAALFPRCVFVTLCPRYAAEPDLSDYVASVDQAARAPAAFRQKRE